MLSDLRVTAVVPLIGVAGCRILKQKYKFTL